MARVVRHKPRKMIALRPVPVRTPAGWTRSSVVRIYATTADERQQIDALVRANYTAAQATIGFSTIELNNYTYTDPVTRQYKMGIGIWKGYGSRVAHGFKRPDGERRMTGYVQIVEEP